MDGAVGAAPGALALTAFGVAAMAGFGLLAARAPASPEERASAMAAVPPEDGEVSAQAFLWFALNVVLATLLLTWVWSPLTILWLAAGLVPVVFVVLMRVAAWGCRPG